MNLEIYKSDPFLKDLEIKDLNKLIVGILHDYFIFRNISANDELKANIALEIIKNIPYMHYLKPSLVKFAIEKIDISQNNISPAVIIDAIKKFYKSDYMSEIIKKYLESSEIKLLPVGQKTHQEKLESAKKYLISSNSMYKKMGIVPFMPHDLFEILYKEGYFKFVTESLESLNEKAKALIIHSLNVELISTKSGDQLYIKKKINEVKSGIISEEDLKINRRKYILELYFKKINNESDRKGNAPVQAV